MGFLAQSLTEAYQAPVVGVEGHCGVWVVLYALP